MHSSPEAFASDLRSVWCNVGEICAPRARLVVRFGGISDRKADPLAIIGMSLKGSGFDIQAVEPAGSASSGNRQACIFHGPAGWHAKSMTSGRLGVGRAINGPCK